MSKDKPQGIAEFPLREHSARKIIKDLAENHSHRIKLSIHVKKRMRKRGVTNKQIFSLLSSRSSVFREGPYEAINGDWKFNLKGNVAGDLIELVVALKNHDKDPSAMLVTVWI